LEEMDIIAVPTLVAVAVEVPVDRVAMLEVMQVVQVVLEHKIIIEQVQMSTMLVVAVALDLVLMAARVDRVAAETAATLVKLEKLTLAVAAVPVTLMVLLIMVEPVDLVLSSSVIKHKSLIANNSLLFYK
tara:strand:+ start:148 stop:537 length:390 start_codon:yes stop_codon:yes gene_type:complete